MAENGSSANGANSASESEAGRNGDDSKLCRDFIRNVCNRGKNCKFIHPENVNIRTEPIFCHDYQQGKCFRSSCKFVHCTREDEEHYKETGVLPPQLLERVQMLSKGRGNPRNFNGGGGMNDSEIPVCKDFLKGVCDRPPGSCKYRHVDPGRRGRFGAPRGASRGGRMMGGLNNGSRRRSGNSFYDGAPDSKRFHSECESPDEFYNDININNMDRNRNMGSMASGYTNVQNSYGTGSSLARNGYNPGDVPYFQNNSSEAMKALEEENFMLKRRIEELKTSNEFLLSQNAQLRLNNSLTRNTVGVESVQSVQVPQAGGGVVQTQPIGMSMAQPIGISSSLSVAPSQPLSTISTLPTVSMPQAPASISQPIPVVSIAQHQPQTVYPMVSSQGVLPPN